MGYAPMMGGGMWCFIFWAAIAIAVLILIVLALRYLGVKGTARAEKSSLEILKERYAKGEISRDEFEAIKKDLEG